MFDNLFGAVTRFFGDLPEWLNAVTAFVAGASAITALTPASGDDKAIGKIKRVLDWIALNVGHAKRVPQGKS